MYTPHTVTLILAEETAEGEMEYNSVILRGVFLDLNKRSNVNKSGLENADSATLYIPFSINPGKQFLPPKEYKRQSNKAKYWTLFDGGESSGTECYFIKGAVSAAIPYKAAREKYDFVYRVTSVDTRDYGRARMQHWQVGGK